MFRRTDFNPGPIVNFAQSYQNTFILQCMSVVHMKKYLVALLLIPCVFRATAQETDSIFAVKKRSVFAIRHILKGRETLSMLAQRYYTSLMSIESANEFDAKRKLAVGDYVFIPLTRDNYFPEKMPLDITDIHKLYYKVGDKDNMSVIINLFPASCLDHPMTKEQLRIMNDLHGFNLTPDQPLSIGWIRMVPPDSANIARGYGYPAPPKAVRAKDSVHTYFGGLEEAYNTATANGTNVLSEKGTAVFFEKPGKNNMYFAFHNTMPRNTVIKVTNPGNNKAVLVRVIGPIPDTKNFSGAIIGISNAAREDLGLQSDTRSWVELTYPVN
jgi:hypothetical protein